MLRVVLRPASRATVRGFATSAPKLLTAAEVKGWDMARVLEYAGGELKLGAMAVEVLRNNEIDGESLLNLTEDKLVRANMPLGPATKLATAIAELRCTPFTLMLKCGGNGKRGTLVPHPFTSSEHFAKFASTNHIYITSHDGRRKGAVFSLSDAQRLLTGDFLMLSTPFDTLDEKIGILDGHVKNTSTGHERATTQAIACCATMRKQFGELHVVSNGYPVVFYDDSGAKVLEADGLVVNSVVLLLNEVKHTPSTADASLQQSRARALMGIVSNPSAFSSEPTSCLPELVRMGIKDVRPVLSGYNFASSVEEACVKEGVQVMKTNGSGYSDAVTLFIILVTP